MSATEVSREFPSPTLENVNLTHLHLVLNHVPILATVFGLMLLAYAMWRKKIDIEKVALGVFVFAAVLGIPAYLTGEPAEDAVKSLPGVFESLVERHEGAATIAFSALGVLGLLSVAGLILFRRGRLIPTWFASLTLAAAILVSGLMAWTGNVGGQIRHTEIRSSGNPSSNATTFDTDR